MTVPPTANNPSTRNGDVPTIRRAIPEDWLRLHAIQAASLSSPWPELLKLAVEHGSATPNPPSASVPGPLAIVAVAAGTLVGYVLALADEASSTLTVVELAVAPGHRRRGHGSALLETVIQNHDGYGIRLTARADDRRAREFYASHGFQADERLPEHYDGVPGVVLVRNEESSRRG